MIEKIIGLMVVLFYKVLRGLFDYNLSVLLMKVLFYKMQRELLYYNLFMRKSLCWW